MKVLDYNMISKYDNYHKSSMFTFATNPKPNISFKSETKNIINKETSNNSKSFGMMDSKTSKVAVFGGVLITTILSITGIKKLASRPTKANIQLAELLDAKFKKMDSHISSFQTACENTYNSYIKKLGKLPKKDLSSPKISESLTKLAKAKTNQELLDIEDELFCNVDKWFGDKLVKRNETENMNIAIGLQEEFSRVLTEKHSRTMEKISEQMNTDDIPDNLNKGKKAHILLEKFSELSKNKSDSANNAKTYTDNLFNEDIKAYLGDIHSQTGELLQTKFKILDKIFGKMNDRIAASNLPDNKLASKADIAKMIPADVPLSIYENPIYKFVLKPEKTAKDYSDFIYEMSENLNLEDMRIFVERLKIRSALSPTSYGRNWYKTLENETSVLKEQIEKLLIKLYTAPVKEVDKIKSHEAELLLSGLCNKFGYKDNGQMVCEIQRKYGIDREILDCTMTKLYQKYYKDFFESNSNLMLIVNRTNKKLFDWENINANFV